MTAQLIDLTAAFKDGDDAYPALQGAVDGIPANVPALVRLGAVNVGLSHPVVCDLPMVGFEGPGSGLTNVMCPNAPAFIFGARRDGGIDAHWVPTVLDSTAGNRLGFASNGDTVLQLANHPACWGGKSKADANAYDHWADLTGYTIEIAFDAKGNQVPLFTLGRAFNQSDGPWVEIAPQANGPALLLTFWEDPGGTAHWTNFPIPLSGLNRVALIWDRQAGFSARLNGQAIQPGGNTDFSTGFARGQGCFPLHVGTRGLAPSDGPAPNFTLYGLKLSTVALHADPGTDFARYFDASTPGCVTTFGGLKDTAPGRLVPFYDAGWQRSYAWAFNTTNQHGFIAGNSLSGMSVWGSPAVALGEVGGFTARDVVFRNAAAGVGSMPRGVSYPMLFDGCDFYGSEVGLNLAWACRVSLRDCNVYQAGNSYARFAGVSFAWRGGTFGFISQAAVNGIEHFRFPAGGPITISDLMIDNEWPALPGSILYCEPCDGLTTTLDVSNVVAARLGPQGSFLHLGPGSGNAPCTVRGYGLSLSGGGGNSSCCVEGAWTGSTNLVGGMPVTGPGAAQVVGRP